MIGRNTSFHERGIAGVLLAPLKLLCFILCLLLGLILGAWVVDWIFVFGVWPEGLARLQEILSQDIARVNQLAGGRDLPDVALRMANFLYALLFRATGIHDMGAHFSEGMALSIPDTIVRNTYLANYEAIHIAMVGTQLFGIRLAMLLMVMPLVVLVYCVSLPDGLVQRAVRRASGGRESASLYHRAKNLQLVLLVATTALHLLVPASIDPRFIWVPAAIAAGVFARIQWSFYKKHL